MSKAQIAFNDQTGLQPLIGAGFLDKFDGLKVTDAGVVIIEAVRLEILVVCRRSDAPVIVNQPANRRASPEPIHLIDIFANHTAVVFLATQA